MTLYCVRALFAASLTALCAPEAATAQASASAQLTDSLSCIAGPGSATPVDLANGGVTADIGSTGLGCMATAGGYSYAGVTGAFAESSVAFDNTSSGGLRGESDASWSDSLHVVWPSGLAVAGVSTLRISFNVDAHGGVAATRSDAEGFNLALGSAGIDYSFSFAGSVFSGSQSMAAGEAQVVNGSFGSLSGFVDLTPTGLVDGAYTFSDIALAMAGHAHALVQNKFIGLGLHTGSALGDFGSTLQWQGISGVQAFDGVGAEVALPGDFQLGLIGGQNGFDYWSAAPITVPEPSAWTSMLCGLGVLVRLGLARRRPRNARAATAALVSLRPVTQGASSATPRFAGR